MKVLFFLVVLFLSVDLKAQVENLSSFNNDPKLNSLNLLFKKHIEIDSMRVEYRYGAPYFLELYFNSFTGKKTRADSYDLSFLGDQFILRNKYKDIITFLYQFKPDSLQEKNKTNDALLSVQLKKSTITSQYISAPWLSNAFCNVGKLRTELQQSFQNKQNEPLVDSVLIFQAIIEKDKTLGDIDLIEGKHSSFSKYVLKVIQSTKNSGIWFPMTNSSGAPIRGLVDIFVKLDQTNTIHVSVTGRARKLKIKDTKNYSPIYY